MNDRSAEDLALGAQQGSKASFAELADRFGPRLFRYFRRRATHRQDCEDLVQETLVKAYQKIHLYREGRSFATWLFTIGTRLSVDFFRSRERARTEPIPNDLAMDADPSELAARRDEGENLWVQARTLPEKMHDALWLRYVEEMPVQEIAAVLGLSRTHVKVLLFRARSRLAEIRSKAEKGRRDPGEDSAWKEVLSC